MPDLSKLSDAELEAANQKLQADRSAIGDEQEALAAERDRRAGEAKVAAAIEGMSPDQLNVLVEAASAKLAAGAPAPGEEG